MIIKLYKEFDHSWLVEHKTLRASNGQWSWQTSGTYGILLQGRKLDKHTFTGAEGQRSQRCISYQNRVNKDIANYQEKMFFQG